MPEISSKVSAMHGLLLAEIGLPHVRDWRGFRSAARSRSRGHRPEPKCGRPARTPPPCRARSSRIVYCFFSSSSVFTMRADSSGPMPAIGSSSSSMRGLVASAIAISSWRCSPWLMLDTTVSARCDKPDAIERRARRIAQLLLLARLLPEMERMSGMRLHGERDIVERGEIGKQRRDLERAREPHHRALIGRQRGDVVAGKDDGAGIRARSRRSAGRSAWSCRRRSGR